MFEQISFGPIVIGGLVILAAAYLIRPFIPAILKVVIPLLLLGGFVWYLMHMQYMYDYYVSIGAKAYCSDISSAPKFGGCVGFVLFNPPPVFQLQ